MARFLVKVYDNVAGRSRVLKRLDDLRMAVDEAELAIISGDGDSYEVIDSESGNVVTRSRPRKPSFP